jgi:hypothetical protein
MPAVDPRVRARVMETCMRFEALGATVTEISIPIHNQGPAYHLAATRMAGYMSRIGATCSRRQLFLNDLQEKFLPWTQEKWDKVSAPCLIISDAETFTSFSLLRVISCLMDCSCGINGQQ